MDPGFGFKRNSVKGGEVGDEPQDDDRMRKGGAEVGT